jgi:hypothetical protein
MRYEDLLDRIAVTKKVQALGIYIMLWSNRLPFSP